MQAQATAREARSHSMAKARDKTLRQGESSYIYGIHDREGAHLLGGKGWVVISEAVGCDPHDWSS